MANHSETSVKYRRESSVIHDNMNMEHLSLCTSISVKAQRDNRRMKIPLTRSGDQTSSLVCSLFLLSFGAAVFAFVVFLRVYAFGEEVNEPYSHQLAPNETVYLNNTHGYELLLRAISERGENDYFLLQNALENQINPAYCAVASVVTALNSLRHHEADVMTLLQREVSEFSPYAYMTQDAIFNMCTNRHVIRRDDKFDGLFGFPYGLGLTQTAELMKCHLPGHGTWKIRIRHVDEFVSVDEMRQDLISALQQPHSRVLVNFDRSAVHQEGMGHVSPIAAYSSDADAFLLLDVAKYKYPPVWIPSTMLHHAMSLEDSCGSWNFPFGQDKLPEDLLFPDTRQHFDQARRVLGCKSTHRGYIVLSKE